MTVEELLEVARLHRLFAKSLRDQAAACDDYRVMFNTVQEKVKRIRELEARVAELEAQLASRGDK